ncbi:hypothetical protein FXO37_20513 [Capsicum annuum]|nr:hypothetical protein FXO37_20513 [Capsicum annuum]
MKWVENLRSRVQILAKTTLGVSSYPSYPWWTELLSIADGRWQLMENADDDGVSKDSQENLEKDTSSTKQEKEVLESPKKQVIKKEIKELAFDDAEMDGSPIMGVMSSKSESVDAQGLKASESSIKKAIWERAAHFRANSEYVSFLASWNDLPWLCHWPVIDSSQDSCCFNQQGELLEIRVRQLCGA